MTYTIKLHTPEHTTPEQHQAAERLFRRTLETTLGDPALVLPVYAAWQAIVAQHGPSPDPQTLSFDQRTIFQSWQQAEQAALQVVFGTHRHLDEGGYDIYPT